MALIHQFVAFPIEQDAPIPRHALIGWMLCADARGAVGGDGVIPTRCVPQGVERLDVFKKSFARLRWRNSRTIKVDILLAIICAQTNHVALIGYYIDEFELPVESADSRVSLTKLLPNLDRETERRRVSELKADNGMGDPGRAPVINREVDAGDLRDAYGSRLPTRCIVRLGPVVAVAYVVKCYFVALDIRPRLFGHVWLPVAIVCGRKRQPPGEHPGKKHDNDNQLSPEWPNEYEDDDERDRKQCGRNLVPIAERSVKPQRAKCPTSSDDGCYKNEQCNSPSNHSRQIRL